MKIERADGILVVTPEYPAEDVAKVSPGEIVGGDGPRVISIGPSVDTPGRLVWFDFWEPDEYEVRPLLTMSPRDTPEGVLWEPNLAG